MVMSPWFPEPPSRELSEQSKNFVKQHLAGHEYPREVEFIDQLSKTPRGKIQSLLLKQRASVRTLFEALRAIGISYSLWTRALQELFNVGPNI